MNKLMISVRIDDVCPTMDYTKFLKIIKILNAFNIKPLLGIIPNNKDPDMIVTKGNKYFFHHMREFVKQGYCIALHGYDHLYINRKSGILKMNNFSEMVGKSFEYQYSRIKKGISILNGESLYTDIYMAPGHSFDRVTIKALVKNNFKYITDGLTNYPFKYKGIIFIPNKNIFTIKKKARGLVTLCLHPNTMDKHSFSILKATLNNNKDYLVNYSEFLKYEVKKSSYLTNLINTYKRYTIKFIKKTRRLTIRNQEKR